MKRGVAHHEDFVLVFFFGFAALGFATTLGAEGAPTLEAPGSGSPQVVVVGEMSVARAAHQATLLESGKVLITGGCSGSCDQHLDVVEVFEPANGQFEVLSSMATARDSHAAAMLTDGRVLVAGGWSQRRATASAEIFDPVANMFNAAGDMGQARAGPVATRLSDGRLLITGGQTSQLVPLASAEVFDPESGTFASTGSMKSARIGHTAVALPDGRVLVAGGVAARRGAALRSAEIYDPSTGRFELVGDMTIARTKHAAVGLLDGNVLIIGGSDSGPRSDRYTSSEIFDPRSGIFASGPEMHSRRYKIPDAVVRLASGDVIVAAGAERLERYEPAGGRFVRLSGALPGPQEFATASLLEDGNILVLGGYDEDVRTSPSAWLVRVAN